MKRYVIKQLLRLKLRATSRASANAKILRETERSLALLEGLSEMQRARSVRVPALMGVDEDMRDWSLYQVLEHNTIVNRAFSRIISGLAQGRPIRGLGDPKKDVMPSAEPGASSVDAFRASVKEHLEILTSLPKLRRTGRHPHPVCGPLDAHGWHAFFGIHLAIHRAQMEAIRERLARI